MRPLLGTCAVLFCSLALGCHGVISNANGEPRADGGLPARDANVGVDARLAPAETDGGAASAAIALRFFNVGVGEVDGRYPTVPDSLSRVSLLPRVTLQADVPSATASVRFTVDGESRIDSAAPFRFSEDAAGTATAIDWSIGAHMIEVEAFASADASGASLARSSRVFTVTAQGLDPTPSEGAHAVHRFWLTDDGRYVHRNGTNDFVDAAGAVVLRAADVTTDARDGGEVHLITRAGAGPSLAFAFTVLLPEGLDEAVPYPLFVSLHHGWTEYRGTDNDPRLVDLPPMSDSRSIVRSALRNTYPAVVLAPQLQFHGRVDGVSHEWAAFTSLEGGARSAPAPSRGATFLLRVIDDLLHRRIAFDGRTPTLDARRLYLHGHSMGGLGTWDLVARQPDFWAAAIPMAGYSDPSRAAALVDTPIWAFHHRNDCYNPFSGTEAMHRLVTETHGGRRMKFTAFDFDTGGDCARAHGETANRAWTAEDLLPWIFSQVNDRRP